MANALIKCPKTGKPLSIQMSLPQNFREMNISINNGTVGPCPHCGDNHTYSMDDIFFEED